MYIRLLATVVTFLSNINAQTTRITEFLHASSFISVSLDFLCVDIDI